MGIIWRSAMPLLTTLAALVIIVHTAEEDLDTDYGHDLRPRTLDTGSSSYDKPWRVVEAEPVIQQPRNDGHWDDSEGEVSKHRRPGRKRKRRPQLQSSEEVVNERYAYSDEHPYFEVEFDNTHQTTEMPKRRRKKPDNRPMRWTDDVIDIERPVRRRGQRRKRPLLATWPELTEIRETINVGGNKHEPSEKLALDDINMDDHDEIEKRPNGNKHEISQSKTVERRLNRKRLMEELTLSTEDDNIDPAKNHYMQDKSLSEFSREELMTAPRLIKPKSAQQLILDKIQENDQGVIGQLKNRQESAHGNSLTLKDILKRSNGTSLSEILQQHNLSLTDLLRGKHYAVSILKNSEALDPKVKHSNERNDLSKGSLITDTTTNKNDDLYENILINSETKYATEKIAKMPVELVTETLTTTLEQTEANNKEETTTTEKSVVESTRKISSRRRYPISIQNKLRLRPMLNNTYKSQLSRDLITLNSMKYSHHRRNITKSNQWKDIIKSMPNNTQNENDRTILEETTTITVLPEETTIQVNFETTQESNLNRDAEVINKLDDIDMEIVETTTEVKEIKPNIITEKPSLVSLARSKLASTGLRRQAFNNRLKRKRLKSKHSSTEPPQDDLTKQLFGMGSLVSSSEFIASTLEPKTTIDETTDFSTLNDFITTDSTTIVLETNDEQIKPLKMSQQTKQHKSTSSTSRPVPKRRIPMTTTLKPLLLSTTEETAEVEIEEILNDTTTNAQLSKILMERNMTIRELVELRERGSSYVHLADIFHNASREPNPPEPFLSKSLIEPISKETYPLRALLDANSYDPNIKGTTLQPMPSEKIKIPVVMDFRNNVNENGENMGIVSLFNNFTEPDDILMNDSIVKSSEEPLVANNITHNDNKTDDIRESRVLTESKDDVVSWNEIFSLMGRNNNNNKNRTVDFEVSKKANQIQAKTIQLEKDAEGYGLIVLEDLQHLKDFDSNIAIDSDERIEMKPFEKLESSHQTPGILNKVPSHTKSVTVATASIAGLSMILFLLTYAAFKWKHQRSMMQKKRGFDEHIPTPVFENRKVHRNSSMRSISPMLQTSNIYTMNTLDSQNGKESPEYMWDSLRKPFQ